MPLLHHFGFPICIIVYTSALTTALLYSTHIFPVKTLQSNFGVVRIGASACELERSVGLGVLPSDVSGNLDEYHELWRCEGAGPRLEVLQAWSKRVAARSCNATEVNDGRRSSRSLCRAWLLAVETAPTHDSNGIRRKSWSGVESKDLLYG